MKAGKDRAWCGAAAMLGWAIWLSLGTGCAASRAHIDKAVRADKGTTGRNVGVADTYLVGCPDVVEIQVAGRPDLTGPQGIGPDGCIELGKRGRLHIEGETLSAIT